MFTHGHIARQIIFVDSAERSQKITGTGPQAFSGIDMDLTDAIAILITCPFMFSMMDGDMLAWNLVVARPFVGIGNRVGLRETDQVLFQRFAIRVFDDAQAHLPTLAPDRADDGRSVIVIGAVPALFVGPASRWVCRVAVFSAFFPPRSETSHRFQL